MSDEITSASLNAHWLVTGALAIWGLFLRVAVGRHYATVDKINERLSTIETDVAQIKGYIKGRVEKIDDGKRRR